MSRRQERFRPINIIFSEIFWFKNKLFGHNLAFQSHCEVKLDFTKTCSHWNNDLLMGTDTFTMECIRWQRVESHCKRKIARNPWFHPELKNIKDFFNFPFS